MRPYNPSDLLQPQKGFIYEPRVLWSRAHREEYRGALISEANFERSHFYNAEQRPIIITDMIFMSKPLEYALSYYPVPFGYGTGSPPAQSVRIRVNRRGVRPFSMDFTPGAIGWKPNTQSGPLSRDIFRSGVLPVEQQLFNDGFNNCRWDLDFPLTATDRGAVQYDLSGTPVMIDGTLGGGFQQFTCRGTTIFAEPADRAQLTPGNARANAYQMQTLSERDSRMFTTPAATSAIIVNAAGFEGIPPTSVFSNLNSTWDNGFGFPSAKFIGAQSAGDGPSRISSIRHTFFKQNNKSFFTQDPQTPPMGRAFGNMSDGIFCRARVRAGGTGAWWWREGAPLSIVSPTQTPQPVYRFPRPFVLAPGEALEATADIGELYPDGSFNSDGYRSHSVHLSFCGYSAIEG